jgi:hypothetical protein
MYLLPIAEFTTRQRAIVGAMPAQSTLSESQFGQLISRAEVDADEKLVDQIVDLAREVF